MIGHTRYGLGPVLDFSFRVLVPESKMIQAERAKFTNVSVPALIFLDQWILLQNVILYAITSVLLVIFIMLVANQIYQWYTDELGVCRVQSLRNWQHM